MYEKTHIKHKTFYLDRTFGGNCHYSHSGGNAAAGTFGSTRPGARQQLSFQHEAVRTVVQILCR